MAIAEDYDYRAISYKRVAFEWTNAKPINQIPSKKLDFSKSVT